MLLAASFAVEKENLINKIVFNSCATASFIASLIKNEAIFSKLIFISSGLMVVAMFIPCMVLKRVLKLGDRSADEPRRMQIKNKIENPEATSAEYLLVIIFIAAFSIILGSLGALAGSGAFIIVWGK